MSASQTLLEILKFNLHDAVYLYLLTVNQTLAEGYPDYRDGRLIRNKTIGQRFAGTHSSSSSYRLAMALLNRNSAALYSNSQMGT